MPAKHPQATRDRALALFSRGATIGEVAAELGLPRDTTRNWYKAWRKQGLLRPRQRPPKLPTAEFRRWVTDNREGLTQVLDGLRDCAASPRPEGTPSRVLPPARLPVQYEELALLQEQLRAYTRGSPVWLQLGNYHRDVRAAEGPVRAVASEVDQVVAAHLERRMPRLGPEGMAPLKGSVGMLAHAYAISAALTDPDVRPEQVQWREEPDGTYLAQVRGGPEYRVPVLPSLAGDKVRAIVAGILAEVAHLPAVHQVRPRLRQLTELSEAVRRSLNQLLVV